jgi:hypothetical protein
MLTVEAGQSLTGEAATLALEAPGRISATGARSAETRRILQPLYGPPDPREPG